MPPVGTLIDSAGPGPDHQEERKPNDVNKLGPVEQWTYKAPNGTVVFLIVADTVTLQAAVPDEKKDQK